MPLDLEQTLSQLVAIGSVNPMGREAAGPPYYEGRLTDHLEQLFSSMGLATMRQTVETLPDGSRRENLIARLEGTLSYEEGGDLILLDVHQDTVPVEGMTISPFDPVVQNGRLYGRGACDVKGSMAAMITAMSRLAEERPTGMPTVILACTVNEEHGFSGVRSLTQLWDDQQTSLIHPVLIPRRPDMCIVAEPTELQVVVAHKGVVRWRCHTPGRAAHSSQPERGENAIYRMGQVLAALARYAKENVTTLGQHPLCGRPSLSVGTIQGGLSVNTVPEHCTIEIDRRLIPGEQPQEAIEHVVEFLSSAAEIDFKVQHDPPYIESPGLTDEENGPLAERLLATIRSCAVDAQSIAVPFGTDAAFIGSSGVPSVVFGPGSIEQAHTADEWIDLEQLQLGSEIYYRFLSGQESSA